MGFLLVLEKKWLSARLWFCGVSRFFSHFLISYDPSTYVVWQLVRQLVCTMFINNNYVSFHLWWEENWVKHQKVSKYYDHDFRWKSNNWKTSAFHFQRRHRWGRNVTQWDQNCFLQTINPETPILLDLHVIFPKMYLL